MNGFDQRATKVNSSKLNLPFAFSNNPSILYATDETIPRVLAVCEIFGVSFTQGVNEMQTLANLSSSRDVLKQGEINQASLLRLNDYYKNYRDSLDFQLTRRSPEMIESLNSMVPPSSPAAPSTASGNTASGSFSYPAGQSLTSNNSRGSITSPTGSTGTGSNPSSQKGFMRRKSVRQSLNNTGGGHNHNYFGSSPTSEAVSQAVIQLKIKVLGYNDRFFSFSFRFSFSHGIISFLFVDYWIIYMSPFLFLKPHPMKNMWICY
jgi:hypothetical protein